MKRDVAIVPTIPLPAGDGHAADALFAAILPFASAVLLPMSSITKTALNSLGVRAFSQGALPSTSNGMGRGAVGAQTYDYRAENATAAAGSTAGDATGATHHILGGRRQGAADKSTVPPSHIAGLMSHGHILSHIKARSHSFFMAPVLLSKSFLPAVPGPNGFAAKWLRRVHSVLREEFGYSLSDLRQFDFAALLTEGTPAVSAAIVDVYGADAAELYLVATRTVLQRQGYGTSLVRQLSAELGKIGVRRLLVSVDDDDEENQRLWRDKFGFKSLSASELYELGCSFGTFSAPATKGTVFLVRKLC
ncbi:hypothetical protein VOLCADRAFT_87924, partial [Volvox carteri f. nagariensis]